LVALAWSTLLIEAWLAAYRTDLFVGVFKGEGVASIGAAIIYFRDDSRKLSEPSTETLKREQKYFIAERVPETLVVSYRDMAKLTNSRHLNAVHLLLGNLLDN
jgi:hypothetical protein